jgi:hypothetical protein
MPLPDNPFQIGLYRPIYLWGGPGTIRMNRLKFMNQPVDEEAHQHAHSEEGARRVLEDMYCNWVHLMYNWGFPPEIEAEDWEDFKHAAEIYHQQGDKVFAYIQTSNCVYDGSFVEKDWYARDPKGEKIFYYSGRYMACLAHPEWVQHLKDVIKGAIERGADGIFFDNMSHGAMPVELLGAWLGAAGCHCERCQAAYKETSGDAIPLEIDPDDPVVRHYLRYRADQTTALITGLVEYIHQLQPGTPVSANDYDHFARPTYVVYGQDLRELAKTKEVTMIENFALPRWDRQPKERLANNALIIRNARRAVGDLAHLSVLSYDVGIGFDEFYPPRRYQQGMAEAAACGASMTTKGTEYFYEGEHTVLTPDEFAPIHKAIGTFNRWLESNASFYAGGRNLAQVGLLFPGEDLWLRWPMLSPLYIGAGQTLTVGGIPWRVVYPGDDLDGLRVLLVFDSAQLEELTTPQGLEIINLPELPDWEPEPPSLVARNARIRSLVTRFVHGAMNAYFSSKLTRLLFDSLGLPKLITQSLLYVLPSEDARKSLLRALPQDLYPRVKAVDPVLIEVWEREGKTQIHLVNYSPKPQRLSIDFGKRVSGRCLSPLDEGEDEFSGSEISIRMDIYKILVFRKGS